MIVISGALVVVAIVLLAIGLISGTLGFIYASIAGSVVAFAFLIVGVFQRRGEDLALPGAGAPALASSGDVEGVTAIIPAGTRPLPGGRDAAAAGDQAAAPVSGSVLVVEGRPRYHVAGCRYLTGKSPDEVAVDKARADGFTACGVCKPDEVLAASAAPPAAAVSETPVETAAEAPVESVPEPAATAETTRRAPARTAGTPAKRAAAKTAGAPAKKAAAKSPAKTAAKAPAKTAAKTAAKAAPAKTAAAKTAAAKATKAPAKKAAAKAAPAKTAGTAAKAPAKKAAKAPAKKAATRR